MTDVRDRALLGAVSDFVKKSLNNHNGARKFRVATPVGNLEFPVPIVHYKGGPVTNTVNVDLRPIAESLDRMTAALVASLKERDELLMKLLEILAKAPAIQFNPTMPTINVAAPNVKVEPPVVTVNTPAVTVNVPVRKQVGYKIQHDDETFSYIIPTER